MKNVLCALVIMCGVCINVSATDCHVQQRIVQQQVVQKVVVPQYVAVQPLVTHYNVVEEVVVPQKVNVAKVVERVKVQRQVQRVGVLNRLRNATGALLQRNNVQNVIVRERVVVH